MKKLLVGVLASMLAFAPMAMADDDEERLFRRIDQKLDQILSGQCPEPVCPECPEPEVHECLVEFIYSANQLPDTAALTVYRVYTLPDGKKFLIPTWAIEPTPQPPEDPEEPEEPEWKPNASNDFNSCGNCHKSDESKFQYRADLGWSMPGSRHEDHEKFDCLKCHKE